MRELEKMKDQYELLKLEVKKINKQHRLTTGEYVNLRKLKQLKLWYKDKISEITDNLGV